MSFLPTIGTITYNGYTFNSATRTRVSARPEYDRAQRTIVAVVYTINLVTYVAEASPGIGADTVVADLRQRLMSPGRSLVYTGQGMGDFQINTAAVKDVMWGPRPIALELEPVGSKALWRITWSVEVAIPECTSATYRLVPMAFNYDVSFAIDADYYTVRTVRGYLEIPLTRSGDGARDVNDSADKYRERIMLPIPEGFRRTTQDFNVSADRRKLDFVFVDEELPSEGMPEGCTTASGMHTISSSTIGSPRQFTNRISASYAVKKGESRKVAWDAFFALTEDRLKQARDTVNNNDTTKDSVIPYGLEITQGLYLDARRLSFSLSYTFLMSLKTIIQGSGIWREVPNTNAQKWAASIRDVAGVRGFAQMKDDPQNDIIVDLCGSTTPSGSPPPSPPPEIKTTPQPSIKQGGYLSFQQAIDIEEHTGSAAMMALPKQQTPEMRSSMASGAMGQTQTYLPAPGPELGSPPNSGSDSSGTKLLYDLVTNNVSGSTSGIQHSPTRFGGPTSPPNTPAITPGNSGGVIPQARTAPHYIVRLRGFSVTLGIAPDQPTLAKFEEADLIPEPTEKVRFTTRNVGYMLGMPLIHAEWVVPYRAIFPNGVRGAR